MPTVTSRHFNRYVSAAERAAAAEPVVITDRGKPSHVLLSIEQYLRLVADQRSIGFRDLRGQRVAGNISGRVLRCKRPCLHLDETAQGRRSA